MTAFQVQVHVLQIEQQKRHIIDHLHESGVPSFDQWVLHLQEAAVIGAMGYVGWFLGEAVEDGPWSTLYW